MQVNLIAYAIPGFVLLLALEAWVAWREQKDWFDRSETWACLAMGIGNFLSGLVVKVFIFGVYWWTYEHRIWTLPTAGVAVWVFAFFADDFSYYWFHRESHSIRWFWASHVVHHSSPKYNLATALRQTWTGGPTGAFVFWLWMPFVGLHPQMVMMLQSISLIYQFWIHTEAIDRLPRWFEYVMNTPSHHRVHHGSDLAYLDKNHGGVLIIWDRLFGTFHAETVRPTYGLTSNIHTANPVRIAFHEWAAIGADLWRAKSLRQVWGYLFAAPGWSPDDSRLTVKQMLEQAQRAKE
jgi:sterol desaturase/sphingolipid hydroxylase (fatty acid hydroxylase superfamily)